MDVVERNPKGIWDGLKKVADDVRKIPLKRKLADCPRVLIVGEIYVRRGFGVDPLSGLRARVRA